PASSLIYVSCHPGTLARDIKRLKSDWQIKALRPIDMFPWTMHVECVTLMSRVKD
ncbi:MAG TPA: 23S rRNA (uracil(1939)-C(5))-methyltransferase RlmD, partial [Clostridium sp.]|nr:23S rRNA (uracil(1939)-C(5))-methyltransferase RlmD [Clostridium sp.]